MDSESFHSADVSFTSICIFESETDSESSYSEDPDKIIVASTEMEVASVHPSEWSGLIREFDAVVPRYGFITLKKLKIHC